MSSRRKQGFQLEVKQSGKVLNWKVLCMAAFWHEFFSYFFFVWNGLIAGQNFLTILPPS